jgi:hypothetical protein
MRGIALLDFHGILYFHDDLRSLGGSQDAYIRCIESCKKSGDIRNEQDIECEVICNGKLPLFFVPNAKDKFSSLMDKYSIVTCTASRITQQQYVLNKLMGSNFDIYSIEYNDFGIFGSKSDEKAWFNLLSRYSCVEVLYEDKEDNITAAKSAFIKLDMRQPSFIKAL